VKRNFKIYKEFIKEEIKQKSYYRFVLNDIQIYVDEFIKIFKNDFKLNCWVIYTDDNSVSLKYFQTSDDNVENIINVKKFMFENAPYFRDLIIHRDDYRIILKFIDVGDPVKFKFFY